MKGLPWLVSCLLLAGPALGGTLLLSREAVADEGAHEVWVIDQSDSTADGGGTLYIYADNDLAGQDAAAAVPERIDLGGAARDLCLAQTGAAPRRPHMVFFNAGSSHAIVSFVATGHVLFMDAATRAPLACLDVGLQAHAAVPSPDETYAVVANQNGKLLQRISTDYGANAFTLEEAATVDLAACTTPSGDRCEDPALRPDNAPICPIVESGSRFTFVTLRGGGLFVIDSTATPMGIVAEYDQATVHPNGCGGVETLGKVYINSGGGTPANLFESDLYAFPLSGFAPPPNARNIPAPRLVFSQDDRGEVDSHGVVLTGQARYLWVADRAAGHIVMVDTQHDNVVGEFSLAGSLSADPAPDLLDIAPSGSRVYVSLRGPNPLSGDPHAATGSTPGLGIVRVMQDGERGALQAIAPISHLVDGVERADPHGLRVRRK
jgi:DNA-binding beta-propeller fold protein YncE